MFNGTVVGNVGRDAELKYLKDGKPVVGFSVASNFFTKNGEETTWVNVNFYGTRAEKVSGYLTRGKQVAVTGTVRNRQYEKDGQKRYSLEIDATDIKLIGSKSDSDTASTSPGVDMTETSVSSASDPF